MSTEVTSPLVKMRHLRAANICHKGARDWFAHHDIEFRRLRLGIPVEEIEATGDKMALDVARIARADHG